MEKSIRVTFPISCSSFIRLFAIRFSIWPVNGFNHGSAMKKLAEVMIDWLLGNLSIKVQKQNHYIDSFRCALLFLQLKYSVMIIHEGYSSLDLVNPIVTLGIFD